MQPKFTPILEAIQTRNLPPRLHFKDGGYYYVHRNKWTHAGHTRAAALRRYIDELADSERLRRAAAILMNEPTVMRRYLSEVYTRARKNAASRDIPFGLSRDEYRVIVARAAGCCEVSGLPFDLALRRRSLRRPFAPSLDRIEAAMPYRFDNCRLVCGLVNAAMSDWGEEPFLLVVEALAAKHGFVELVA